MKSKRLAATWALVVFGWGVSAAEGVAGEEKAQAQADARANSQARVVAATDAAFSFRGFVRIERESAGGAVWFDRELEVPGRGYRWDSPGGRIGFRTDARRLSVRLRYSERHGAGAPRNGVGLFLIDGRGRAEWRFDGPEKTAARPVDCDVRMPVPAGGGFHDYAIVLPYADSVKFLGVEVEATAAFEPTRGASRPRYVAFGDSVTHGFTASHVGRTYPYLLAERQGWELTNLGFGGRQAHAADAALIAARAGEIVSILIGVNDWQGGIAPEDYRRELRGLLSGLRERQPDAVVFVVTPLWVSPKWQPKLARFPLERYREVAREVVADMHRGDVRLHLVEGPELIDHDERFFDPVLVHPNDSGFAQLAERLAARMEADIRADSEIRAREPAR